MTDAKILLIARNEHLRNLLHLHLNTRGYEAVEVGHGVEAARRMREFPPDLLLIDQDVPMGGMKTAQLLRQHPRCQQIPVILLVDKDADHAALVEEGRCVNLDTFIAKPCSSAALERAIKQGLRRAPPPLSVAQLRQDLARLTQLPVLSPVHRKVLALLACEDDQVDIPELVRTLQADQGLTTAVMRVCHSAYYGFRGNTVEGATTFLGIERIRAVVQAMIVFDVFSTEDDRVEREGFSILELWRHSVACGVIMEEGGHQVKGRDHFIAGLLHDIGKVVVHLRFPDHFGEILRLAREEEKSMYQAERELLGLTHADIGHELARKWDLPPTIATCIAFHHTPAEALQHRRLSALVHIGDIMARSLDIGHGGDRHPVRMDEAARPIARYLVGVAERKEQIRARVDSIVQGGENISGSKAS